MRTYRLFEWDYRKGQMVFAVETTDLDYLKSRVVYNREMNVSSFIYDDNGKTVHVPWEG